MPFFDPASGGDGEEKVDDSGHRTDETDLQSACAEARCIDVQKVDGRTAQYPEPGDVEIQMVEIRMIFPWDVGLSEYFFEHGGAIILLLFRFTFWDLRFTIERYLVIEWYQQRKGDMIENSGQRILHDRIAWLAVVALLFLRIPFTIVRTYMFPSDNPVGPAIFHVGTYLLTAFLIWWERKVLSNFHIDPLALAVIILLKPVQTLALKSMNIDTPLTFPHPAGILLWVIAVGLIIALWVGGYRPKKIGTKAWAWLGFGLLTGLALSVLDNYRVFLASANMNGPSPVSLSSVATFTGRAFVYHLGFASISEEPLFRGFLWGYLRRLGWKDIWIWPAQAAIFMSAHLYFIDALPFEFWIVVPLAGLILGLFAWRSSSVV